MGTTSVRSSNGRFAHPYLRYGSGNGIRRYPCCTSSISALIQFQSMHPKIPLNPTFRRRQEIRKCANFTVNVGALGLPLFSLFS